MSWNIVQDHIRKKQPERKEEQTVKKAFISFFVFIDARVTSVELMETHKRFYSFLKILLNDKFLRLYIFGEPIFFLLSLLSLLNIFKKKLLNC